jgi:MFS family permease
VTDTSLRAVFAGDRGRLLVGLLFAEFGAAIQAVAEAAVLPLASRELHGAPLYGATVAGPALSAILFAILGPSLTRRLGPRGVLLWSTLVYVAGVLLAVLAPAMSFVLAGRILQGAAAGLLSAFGLNALGALYEDAIRTRVIATFSIVWLLPSVVGPVVNAVVASLAGWRWAMAWPAVVVIAARIVIGRRASLLPAPERGAAAPVASGVVVLAALALAAAAPGLPAPLRVPVWAAALLVAGAAGWAVLRRLTARSGARMLNLAIFGGMILTYFGGEALLSLGLIEVAGVGVVGASIAFAAGAATWSVFGLRPAAPRLRPAMARIGAALVTAAAAALAAVMLPAAAGPLALLVGVLAWGSAGAGMGSAWPILGAAVFDAADEAEVPPLSAASAFVQAAAGAAASLLGGGFYSVTAGTLPPPVGIGGGFALVAAVGVATFAAAVVQARTRARRRPLPA